jgi:hypothetical protein
MNPTEPATPADDKKPAAPLPVDLDESVAGEEDPGASLDLGPDTEPVPAPTPREKPKT